jgi:hypothetical protein
VNLVERGSEDVVRAILMKEINICIFSRKGGYLNEKV